MGCSHTGECPLFPLLNASVRGWREYYCDSAYGWQGCARYKLSRTGRLVPITLLPNGADALHLRVVPAADGFTTVPPRQVPPRLDPRFPRMPAARFEPAPTPVRFESAPTPARMEPALAPVPPVNPALPAPTSHHSGVPSAGSRRPVRRRWWTRLADWITGPA